MPDGTVSLPFHVEGFFMSKRTFFIILFAVICLLSVNAEQVVDLYAFTDLALIQSAFISHLYCSAGIGATVEKELSIEIPVSLYADTGGGNEILLESSVNVVVFPWSCGPYISLSLIDLIAFLGDYAPKDSIHYLSTIAFGYNWEVNDRWAVSPRVTIHDPSVMYEETLSYIRGFIPTFPKVSFSLYIRYSFAKLSAE